MWRWKQNGRELDRHTLELVTLMSDYGTTFVKDRTSPRHQRARFHGKALLFHNEELITQLQ